MKFRYYFSILLVLVVSTTHRSMAQTTQVGRANTLQLNTITTAVPFLMISGNAYQLGQAEVGVVSHNHYMQSAFQSNAALLANGHQYAEIHSAYTPWLRALVPDINMFTRSIAGTINRHHALGLQYKLFNLGEIQFTDQNGNFIRNFRPYEHSLQLNYAAWLANGLSIGVGLKHIFSNLTGGINVSGVDTKPGQAFAADIGFNYRGHKDFNEEVGLHYALGLGLNNIGNKISYTRNNEQDFIPTNMQVGVMAGPSFRSGKFRYDLDFAYQLTKLLVPTPPEYLTNSSGTGDSLDVSGNRIIAAGKDPNVGVFQGMIQSFSDAPGGTAEELRELNHHAFAEFRYFINRRVTLNFRGGYFYEHETKGGRQFATVGFGLGVFGVRMDIAAIIPQQQGHPLSRTIAFQLGYRWRLVKTEKYTTPHWNPKKEELELSELEMGE